jgi:hypothetical protein
VGKDAIWQALALTYHSRQLFAGRYQLEELPAQRVSGSRGVVVYATVANWHVRCLLTSACYHMHPHMPPP